MRWRGLHVSLMAMSLGLGCGAVAQGEWYVGGHGGYAFTPDLTEVRGTGAATGAGASDLRVRNHPAFGVKAGYFLSGRWRWVGVEGEFFHHDANLIEQPVQVTNGSVLGVSGNGRISRLGLAVNTWALNLIVRYPGNVWQPYIGVGAGVTLALLRTDVHDTTVVPSLNLLAGVRAFMTERVAVFGEFKHYRATLDFATQGFEAAYRSQLIVGGISYHFH